MDHVVRLCERPLNGIATLVLAIPFVAVGAAMMYSAVIRSTASILGRVFMLALGGLSVAFFGVGSSVYLCSVGLRLLRPRPVLEVDAQGWTYAPTGRWTQRVAWQDFQRVALLRQPVRSKRRYVLMLEDERSSEPTPSEAHIQTATPAAPSDSVVLPRRTQRPLFAHHSRESDWIA